MAATPSWLGGVPSSVPLSRPGWPAWFLRLASGEIDPLVGQADGVEVGQRQPDALALLDYNARQLTATTVAGLAVDIADLLAAAAADPRAPLPPFGSRPPLTS